MNKKANSIGGLLILFMVFVGIMALGLIFGLVGTIVTNVWDITEPVITGLPAAGGVDIGAVAGKATAPATAIINSLYWVTGVAYILMLVGTLILAYAFRTTGEKYLIVLFFILSIILVMASILISNVYQGFYESASTVGTTLTQMELLSWLMLYSPWILTIIAFIGAIIMFSGFEEVQIG